METKEVIEKLNKIAERYEDAEISFWDMKQMQIEVLYENDVKSLGEDGHFENTYLFPDGTRIAAQGFKWEIVKIEECQIHDWDTSVVCHNTIGKVRMTYLHDGERITIPICDECASLLGDPEWGEIVDSPEEVQKDGQVFLEEVE